MYNDNTELVTQLIRVVTSDLSIDHSISHDKSIKSACRLSFIKYLRSRETFNPHFNSSVHHYRELLPFTIDKYNIYTECHVSCGYFVEKFMFSHILYELRMLLVFYM